MRESELFFPVEGSFCAGSMSKIVGSSEMNNPMNSVRIQTDCFIPTPEKCRIVKMHA